jgi:lysophospholipase L1-like esterase
MKEQRKTFFFWKKRTKKTFAPLRACMTRTARPDDGAAQPRSLNRAAPHLRVQSFFASFCSQKEGLAFLLLLSSCAMPPASGAAAPPDVTPASYQPAPHGGLNGFFYDLKLLQQGKRKSVTIVWIGDSHTAADFFSGQVRDNLQAQFGNAGIGTRVAGLPFYGVRQKDMTISQTGHWQYYNSLKEPYFPDYSISGFTAVSRSAGAALSLTVTDPRGYDTGAVDVAEQPGGGLLSIEIDGQVVQTVTTAGRFGLLHIPFHAPAGHAQTLRVIAHAKGIEILDWSVARRDPGVLLDSFGVVGATAAVTQNWDPDLARAQLALLHPALIVLAFGTNEGASPDFSPADYAVIFGNLLNNLHQWAPGSSILIVSPTDGSHHPPGCTSDGCPWVTLPSLAAVRQVQLQVAATHHAAVWNAAGPEMEGGGMNGWADQVPPLGRGDHVHFTAAGYTLLGNALYGWLTQAYTDYVQAHP